MDTIKVTGDHRFIKFEKPYPVSLFRETMSYRVKGWFFIPAVKDGTWDGYKSLISFHKIPTGLYRALKPELMKVGHCEFEEHIELTDPPPTMPGIVSDRVYQNECAQAMVDSIPLGGGTVLAATSAGKTRIAAIFYSKVDGNHLFLVDQIKLLHQARADIASVLGEPVGIVGDGYFEPQRVTVATVQTLVKSTKLDKLLQYLGCLETVIVDEIQTQLGLRNFETVANLLPRARFGLTATIQLENREVYLKLHAFSGPVIYDYPIERGIREGVLSKVIYLQLLFNPKVSAAELKKDPGINQWLENVVHHPEKNKALRQLVTGYLNRNRYIVVLGDKHIHLNNTIKILHEHEPMLITGRVKRKVSEPYIDKFERGDNRLIVASRVFNKGVSIKRIDVILNVGEMEDANTIVQQIGRELRLHDDKHGAIFVDLGTTTGRFGKAARARLASVRAAGIPTQVFSWSRNRKDFFNAAKPHNKLELK